MKAKPTLKSPKAQTERAKPRSVQRVVRARCNHMYREIPAKIGSVAVCGHVKNTKRGFIKDAQTCNACVQAVVGPRLEAQRPNDQAQRRRKETNE